MIDPFTNAGIIVGCFAVGWWAGQSVSEVVK